MTSFENRRDARAHVVTALGEAAAEHDVDAITAAVFEYRIDRDEQGRELANSARIEQVVDAEEFWRIVEANRTA